MAGRWLTVLRQRSRDARKQAAASEPVISPDDVVLETPDSGQAQSGEQTPNPSHDFLADASPDPVVASPEEERATRNRDAIDQAKRQIQPVLINRIDVGTALTLGSGRTP